MDPTIEINETVDVLALYKKNGDRLTCVPSKMHYRGQDIIFTKLGLKHPTAQGKRMIHVFEMSDGANDYRLEFDAEALTWKLVAIIEGRS